MRVNLPLSAQVGLAIVLSLVAVWVLRRGVDMWWDNRVWSARGLIVCGFGLLLAACAVGLL